MIQPRVLAPGEQPRLEDMTVGDLVEYTIGGQKHIGLVTKICKAYWERPEVDGYVFIWNQSGELPTDRYFGKVFKGFAIVWMDAIIRHLTPEPNTGFGA